ncbi:MAG TPA: large-conductance mechanosensitive channel protein MscL [Fimbriimonadaceae bacterium]|nr:large-conductance mechanosensitive channel protein MscL [Fimbriimonadaceae bacterium]
MLKEFREFIAKGNMLDLAVGIVIGAAFTAIVNSLVKDIITPILGLFGSRNFDQYTWTLKEGVTLNYGSFITAVINFLIVAFVLFAVVKAANRFRRKEEAPAPEPAPSNEELLLTEIRDLLKAKT